jgi:hypothetical protein
MKKHILKKRSNNLSRVKKLLTEFDWLFGTQNYERKIILKKEDSDGVSMEFTFDDKYQWIDLTIYPTFFRHTLEQQRKQILHEFCHSITLPSKTALYEFLEGRFITPQRIKEINEKETSQMENLFNGLLNLNYKFARKAYKDYFKK